MYRNLVQVAFIVFCVMVSLSDSQAQLTKNLGLELIGPLRGQSKQVNMFIGQGLGLDYQLSKEVTASAEISILQGLVWRKRRANDRTFPFGTSLLIGGKIYPLKECYFLAMLGRQTLLEKVYYTNRNGYILNRYLAATVGVGISPSPKIDLSFRVLMSSNYAYASIRGAYRF